MVKYIFSLLLFCSFMLYSQESDLSGRSEEPVVAVVLAGGGAMGLAHVGVLQVLEEEGIYPDLVIGSSMGSIIGGLYCTGYSPWEMEELFYDIDWKHVLTDSYDRSRLSFEQKMAQAQYALTLDNPLEPRLRDSGFSHGQHVMEFLDELLTGYSHEMDFDGLPIPFRAVGADLITGEEILYSQGDLKTVIRASMAVPGVFTPVNYRGRYIIDGDWVDNLPTRVARDLGADIVIAVSLYSMKDNPQDLASLEAVNYQAFQIRNVERQVESIQAADLVIAPQFHEFSFLDFENGEALIEEGYNAASSLRQEIAILADQMGKDALHFRDIDRDIAEYSISRVVVNRGESFLVEADFHEELKEYLGETANIEQLQDFLYSYYDRGDYSHFWYQIIPGINDTYTLKIDAPRRDRERESLSLGLDYSSYLLSNNVANITAHVAYRRWIGKDNDFSAGVDLSLSQFPRIQVNSQYYFLNRSINLTAETHWQQTPRLFYGEDSLSSVYGNTAYGGSLTMSIPLFRVTQFSGGIYGERHQTDHRQGEDFLIDEDWFRYGVNASMIVDTLDRVYAPKKGLNSLILFDSSLDLQQNPLNRLVIAEEVYYPFFQERLILSASWESQHLFLGNPRALEQRALGESVGMTGYFDQELPCDNGALAALDIRYRLTSLPLGLGNEVYLRLRGNSAVLWENLLPMEGEELSFHHGFSLGVMMNTIIGEASMDCSINDQNRFSVRLGLTTSSGLIR